MTVRRARPLSGEAAFVVRELPPAVLTDILRALFPTRLHPIPRRRFTLLDTFDGRIRHTGARLMRAGANGTTMLAWQSLGGRTPLELATPQPVRFAWDLPDGPLQQRLAPVIGVRCLLAQAEAEGYGSLLEILDERGKVVARVRIESGQARLPASPGGWQLLPTIVSVCGLRGYDRAYERVVLVIESRPGLEACPEGLSGVVLQALGVNAGASTSALDLDLPASLTAEDGARRIHRALASIIEANEPGVRGDLDSEFLHDYRVAVRRTRSLLGQIRDVFPPETVQHFASEFSWLGRLTGPPRDMDVLLLAVRDRKADMPPSDRQDIAELLDRIRVRERSTLLEAFDSERYRSLSGEWLRFLDRSPVSESPAQNARRPFREVASDRAWRLYKRILRHAEGIDARTPAPRIHQLRIDAKKLRYVIDVTPGLDDTHSEPILGSLKRLQRVLGDFNDAQVQEHRLVECGRTAAVRSPGVLMALRRLAEQRRQLAESMREPVADQLARFGAADMRSIFRRAFKSAGREGCER